MAPSLNDQQKLEFLTDIELCGGPWDNKLSTIKAKIRERIGHDKPLYQDNSEADEEGEIVLGQRLAYYLNNQKAKKPSNYIKHLKKNKVKPSKVTLRKLAEEAETGEEPVNEVEEVSEEVVEETSSEEDDEEEEAVVESSTKPHQQKGATSFAVHPGVKTVKLKPPETIMEEATKHQRDAADDLAARLSTLDLSAVADTTDRSTELSNLSSALLASPPLCRLGNNDNNNFATLQGTATKPEKVVISSMSNFPFSNGLFYITREQVGTIHGVVWQVKISFTASPSEISYWSAVSPPVVEALTNTGCSVAFHGCRSVLLKGPRLSHPLLVELEDKLGNGTLSADEQRFFEWVTDEDHPQNASYSWLIVFPEEIVFNNSTTQRNLSEETSKLTISANNGPYPLNNDVVTAKFVFSIDEYQNKTASSKKKFDKQKMKAKGF